MSFKKHLQEDRRLVILRLLNEANGHDLNSSILHAALNDFGHQPSRDLLHADIAWLEEQGLITSRSITSVVVVKLTKRGVDVALGRATVPGIKRPGPEE